MPGTSYLTHEPLEDTITQWQRAIDRHAEHRLKTLRHPALLVIDAQRYFLDPEGRAFLPAAHRLLPNMAMLVSRFRENGLPVLFTRHGHKRDAVSPTMEAWWNGRLLYEDDRDAELISALGAHEERMIVRKQHYDAFRDTALAQALARLDVETLVICGVMTDLCVETTARSAFMNEFQPVVALDATATTTEALHLAALATLAHGFAYVEQTTRICEMLK